MKTEAADDGRIVIEPAAYRNALLVAFADQFYLTKAQDVELAAFQADMTDEELKAFTMIAKLMVREVREAAANPGGPQPTLVDDLKGAVAAVNAVVSEIVAEHGRVLSKVVVS